MIVESCRTGAWRMHGYSNKVFIFLECQGMQSVWLRSNVGWSIQPSSQADLVQSSPPWIFVEELKAMPMAMARSLDGRVVSEDGCMKLKESQNDGRATEICTRRSLKRPPQKTLVLVAKQCFYSLSSAHVELGTLYKSQSTTSRTTKNVQKSKFSK